MKVEQLIVQYLYNSKNVTIQDIGSFSIAPDVVLPSENEKEAVLPAGAIHFEFDPKAQQDESLVEFIMQQTRKIRPLAASDLESYTILSKQFLNLGKPLVIEGLGTLQKKQSGAYEFTQGQLVNARLESAPSKAEEKQTEEISFRSTEKRNGTGGKKGGMIALLLLLVLVIGAAVFYLLHKKEKPAEESTAAVQDTVAVPVVNKPDTIPHTDTIAKTTPDSSGLKPAAPVASNDGYTFKVVIKEYQTKEAAEQAYARLTKYGRKMLLIPIDSVHYKLAMPFTLPLSDTTRTKDSLALFFAAKTYIDLH